MDLPLEIELALIAGANAHHFTRLCSLVNDGVDPFQLPVDRLRKECPHTRWPPFMKERRYQKLAEQVAVALTQGKCQRISWQDQHYPELLRQIHSPPAQLFYRGDLSSVTESSERPLWSIVGTRRASQKGAQTCRGFARELAVRGMVIVSGLASGIDSAAHRGALETGSTVAVLGTGLDRSFPIENRKLQDQVGEQGLLLTEFPPGADVQSSNFPQRNRIVAGLSRGVLVAEAPLRSGALITARLALEENREVFAFPGQIGDPRYAGNLKLLHQGAQLAIDPADILTALYIDSPNVIPEKSKAELPPLTIPQAAVMECLGRELSLHLDELLRRTGLPRGELALLLMELELAGLLQQSPGQLYSRVDAG